jgi:TRAP-type uncharacterized transport system fused permease subunit
MMAWKYTLPALLVPFAFTLHPAGLGLLLKGTWTSIAWTAFTSAAGLASMAAALTGCLLIKTVALEQVLLFVAGLLLLYPEPAYDFAGLALFAVAFALQWRRPQSSARRELMVR